MPIINKQSLFAASIVVAQLAISPVFAQSTPKLEKEQLGNSAAPDVDPGASKGTDESIIKQERDQLGNSTPSMSIRARPKELISRSSSRNRIKYPTRIGRRRSRPGQSDERSTWLAGRDGLSLMVMCHVVPEH